MKSTKRDPPITQYRENIGKHNEREIKKSKTPAMKEYDSKQDRNVNFSSLSSWAKILLGLILLIGVLSIINVLFPNFKYKIFK